MADILRNTRKNTVKYIKLLNAALEHSDIQHSAESTIKGENRAVIVVHSIQG